MKKNTVKISVNIQAAIFLLHSRILKIMNNEMDNKRMKKTKKKTTKEKKLRTGIHMTDIFAGGFFVTVSITAMISLNCVLRHRNGFYTFINQIK